MITGTLSLAAYLDACGRNGGKPLGGPDLERFLPWNAIAVPPPVLARDFGHGRLARVLWRRSLTPERILGDQDRPAA